MNSQLGKGCRRLPCNEPFFVPDAFLIGGGVEHEPDSGEPTQDSLAHRGAMLPNPAAKTIACALPITAIAIRKEIARKNGALGGLAMGASVESDHSKHQGKEELLAQSNNRVSHRR